MFEPHRGESRFTAAEPLDTRLLHGSLRAVMSDRPLLFISAVSAEHRSLRTTIAALLDHEGYDTDFQEVLGTEHGDISEILARHADRCAGVIQLVGQRYGFAPPAPHSEFGECSYTQFEALYARSIGKPVRYLLLDPAHPSDALTDGLPPEPPKHQALQAAYRLRVEKDTALCHHSTSIAETKNRIDELRPVLEELRREWRERMDRLEREQRRPWRLPVIAGIAIIALQGAATRFGKKEPERPGAAPTEQQIVTTRTDEVEPPTEAPNAEITSLDWLEERLAELAEQHSFRSLPREDVLAELARLEGITVSELQFLLKEARASTDLSSRAQVLMIEQQFPEAAALSREAGDGKAARLRSLQAPSPDLARVAALDYLREGLAHQYQAHLPLAITAYETALEQVTRFSHPELWALLHSHIGNGLVKQCVGIDPATVKPILARAISAYRAALGVLTHETQPQLWAATQINQAKALYLEGILTEGQAGLELLKVAASASRAVIEASTRADQSQVWAAAQITLANALKSQGKRTEGGEGPDLLKQAVTAHREALGVFTRETHPDQWATTQQCLGMTLHDVADRYDGQPRLKLLGSSVTAYRAALGVFTQETAPQLWAMSQRNLGHALKSQGDDTLASVEQHLLYREAESAFQATLEVWTKEASLRNHEDAQRNLAILREKMASN